MLDIALLKHWQSELLATREVPGRGDCVVQRFIYTCGLLTHVTFDRTFIDYTARYCYDSAREAVRALQTWDGVGDPPGDWIKEKVSERLGPGAQ